MRYRYRNTIARHMQDMIQREDFLFQLENWLGSLDEERMRLLKQILFDIEISDLERLKDIVYKYGGCLTERNYVGRKFFEQMVQFVRQMELNQRIFE